MDVALAPADGVADKLHAEFAAAATTHPPQPDPPGLVGRTLFDLPGSEDLSLTVLVLRERLHEVPSQSLVRIDSRPDGRCYLGVVTAGPFAEPDSLRGDSPVLKSVALNGGAYLPAYHGRVQVMLLGERLSDNSLVPPRLRPLPHSPVFRLSEAESVDVLRAAGDLRLGLAVGHESLPVGVPSAAKAVLPRHTAILGTTGGGKSTTVAGLVHQARAAGMAVILLDVEGEYTFLNEPADDPRMRAALASRGLKADGLPDGSMSLYHLVGRDTTNPAHPDRRAFSIQFARLSPYAVSEMLDLNDAQDERFFFAYEVAKRLLRELGVFPQKNVKEAELERQERIAERVDEFQRGYPRMTLSLLVDVVTYLKGLVSKTTPRLFNTLLKSEEGQAAFKKYVSNVKEIPGSASSWGKLQGKLWRLLRLKVFDHRDKKVMPLDYAALLEPGRVSVVDLSDAGMTELCNFAIADLLRGIQQAQESAYAAFEKAKREGKPADAPPRVLLFVEEAHEFLSEERIAKTPVLYQQLERLAKRGRKRWLGLAFVTQLPQHLPRQVLGLVNNYVLHKITDPRTAGDLRKTVSGIDESLWTRLPGLAPGQAIVSFAHMTRPLLVSVDPAPGKLRLID